VVRARFHPAGPRPLARSWGRRWRSTPVSSRTWTTTSDGLIDHLKKIGEYDNTIFIVFGDNGAEGNDLYE